MLTHPGIWLNHFEYHSQHPRRLPAGVANHLTPGERHLIAESIATFQLTEASGATNLLCAAYRFPPHSALAPVARIAELFIREQQQHATMLRAFMADHRISAKTHAWTDRFFCPRRRPRGFEAAVSVLLTAELVGTVYYRALERATGCQKLRALCRVLVADELAHVGFESDLLLAMRADRSAAARVCTELLHRVQFSAAAGVAWIAHRRVLRRGGLGFLDFWRACRTQYRFYLRPPQINRRAA